MMRGMRGNDVSSLTPANEALMFAISYAAVTSMEEDDVSMLGLDKIPLKLALNPDLLDCLGHDQLWLHESRP